MKKIITFSAALVLGVCAFGATRNVRAANADVASDLQTLINSFIDENGQYTKKSTIFLTNEGVDAAYFHAGHTVLQRTTYYRNNVLLMGDLNGGFTGINSGYANDGSGNMVHFSSKAGIEALTDSEQRQVDYTVTGKTMSDYFYNLQDLSASIKAADWSVSEGVYTHTITDLTLDANGDYNDTLLKKFQYFAAPMLLQNKKGVDHYLTPETIEVQSFAGALLIKIYAPLDSGKLSSTDNTLAEAWVYKDIVMPGYFVTGDFADWKILNANRMGAGNDQNYAILEDFLIDTAGGLKIVHIQDNGIPAWHGNEDDDGNVAVIQSKYNIYMSKNEHAYADRIVDATGWKVEVNGVEVAVTVNPGNVHEIMLLGHPLNANDLVVITNDIMTYDYSNLKSGCISVFDEGAGGEIKIKSNGYYSFYIDLTIESGEAVWGSKSDVGSASIIGPANGGDWDTDQPMTISGNTASIEVTLAAGDVFKVRINENWDTSYGPTNVGALPAGIKYAFDLQNSDGNIHVKKAGTYTISLALDTKAISITGSVSGGEDANELVLEFAKPNGWGSVYLYAWGEGNVKNANWPGIEVTEMNGSNYVVRIDTTQYTSFIISDNGSDSNRTGDRLVEDYATAAGLYNDNGQWKTW